VVYRKTLLAGCVCALASGAAMGQDGWSGDVEAGLNLTSGNTDETSINSRADVTRDWADWRQNVVLQQRYTEQDDQRTAERYQATSQLDYKFTDHDYVFLRGRYDDDSFSGYEFQASASGGYGRRVWEESESFLDTSIGAGYRYSRFDVPDADEGKRREEPIGRLAANFRYKITPTSSFRQELESEVGMDDGESLSKSKTSLQANLMGSLAMRLSYTVERDSNPPEGVRNTDTITNITLLYDF